MATRQTTFKSPVLLGIEGGGSHTVCLLTDGRGNLIHRHEAGPANILLLSDQQFRTRLLDIKRALADQPAPDALCLGLAGAHGDEEFARVRSIAEKIWFKVPMHVTHDLETALTSVERIGTPSDTHSKYEATILVLSGTGSCFLGKAADGRISRFGGWGHVIGDKGSGWEIGLRALKACTFYYDRDARWTRLGQRILRALQMNHPRELIPWSPHASKAEIAVLAKEVFAAHKERDPIAKDILAGAAASLAKDAISCANKLISKDVPLKFVFAGSVLLRQPGFAARVAKEIRSRRPQASCTKLGRESAWGAVVLAARLPHASPNSEPVPPKPKGRSTSTPQNTPLSTTEKRHPKSHNLDHMPVGEAIELMLDQDRKLPKAILAEKAKIQRVVREITKAFKKGGRLFYIGAGTSGRLGVLDASECPPTFRADPEMVQGIIAGGAGAVFRSVEGAEDDASAGAAAVSFRGVGVDDVVVGIAASGRTPFVHGALAKAHERGAFTALVCFNPSLKRPPFIRSLIAPDIGPELLTGSTRLKSGTATKLILNIFTTLAMVGIGKVVSNLMIDMDPSNVKLRARAIRMVVELTDVNHEDAKGALTRCNWVIRTAVDQLGRPGN
ncbi:MAG: N-acetylmuramic acid 6-phosphate etherase [Verrucomicrobiia bacterium]|jgi:N-acetylmuramic acid 6-phosphate etherase